MAYLFALQGLCDIAVAFSFDGRLGLISPLVCRLLPLLLGEQRTMSNGRDSAAGGGDEDGNSGKDEAPGGQRGVGGAAPTGVGNQQPAGRGRGAFSQYLRTHEVRTSVHPPPNAVQHGQYPYSNVPYCTSTSMSQSRVV